MNTIIMVNYITELVKHEITLDHNILSRIGEPTSFAIIRYMRIQIRSENNCL